jgi:hypothetical protein
MNPFKRDALLEHFSARWIQLASQKMLLKQPDR